MVHALLCSLALIMSTGCATHLFVHGERRPGIPASSESVAVAQGMSPLIRTTRGAGLVVGVRVPFDLGRAPDSDTSAETSPLLSMLRAKLGSFVNLQRAAQPKSLSDFHIPVRTSL
jgi:hypothetical protein